MSTIFPFGVARGVNGAHPDEELQLNQVRLMPADLSPVNSRSDVTLTREFRFPHSRKVLNLAPVWAANMFGVGTLEMAKVFHEHNMLVALDKYVPVDQIISFLKAHNGQTAVPTVGFGGRPDRDKLRQIFHDAGKNAPQMIVIDVPNGHMNKMIETIKAYRGLFPDVVIVAGNVATGSMAKQLIKAGADIVKAGIGPGSACTTKLQAGTHRPQFAVVRDCAKAVHSMGGLLICDGGVRTAGDVAVALACGADFVMIGGALAAHDESGQPIYEDEKGYQWQEFMGSSSTAYMKRNIGDVAHYRAAEGELQWLPHKGSITQPGAILHEIEGGLRSALSYQGVHTMEEWARKARKIETLWGCMSSYFMGTQIKMVKAEMPNGNGKSAPGKIVKGHANPITGAQPDPELIRP